MLHVSPHERPLILRTIISISFLPQKSSPIHNWKKIGANDEEFIEGRILNETSDRNIPESAFDTFRKETFGRLLPPTQEMKNKGMQEVRGSEWDEEESDSEQHLNGHKPRQLEGSFTVRFASNCSLSLSLSSLFCRSTSY